DELAPDREIVDGTPVVHRVDDGCRFRGKASEILSQRQSGDVDFGGQKGLQRHRRRQFAGANETARDIVDLPMNRLKEMLRLEKVADAIERLVIDQDRAQKGLLRLDIVQGGAVGLPGLPPLFAYHPFKDSHGSESPANRKSSALHPRSTRGDGPWEVSPIPTARK